MLNSIIRSVFDEMSELFPRVIEESASRWQAFMAGSGSMLTLSIDDKWLNLRIPLQLDTLSAWSDSMTYAHLCKVASKRDGLFLTCEIPRVREEADVAIMLRAALSSFAAAAGALGGEESTAQLPACCSGPLASLVANAGWQALSRDEGVGVPLHVPDRYFAARLTVQDGGWLQACAKVVSLASAPAVCLQAVRHCVWRANGIIRFARFRSQDDWLIIEAFLPDNASVLNCALSSMHAGVALLGQELMSLSREAAVAQAFCTVNHIGARPREPTMLVK